MQGMKRNVNPKPWNRSKPEPARGTSAMIGITNLAHKRVCDISADGKVVEIRKRECVTRIKANPDGTLGVTNERENPQRYYMTA